MRARADELIAYHSPIAHGLNAERTTMESALIPMTAYIVVACVEAWHRYPDICRTIDAARPAEDLGRAGHTPGVQIDPVYLWGASNFWLTGHKVMMGIDPSQCTDPRPAWTVLDFWERAARAYRHDDGTRMAVDAGDVVRAYGDDVLATLLAGVEDVAGDEGRAAIKRFNATLTAYLFLLYFDTRVGTGNTGPYPLPDGRTLIVRDFYRLAESDFAWSGVARDLPYSYLTAALVLDGVDAHVTDFGTLETDPEDYLDHLVGFGLFTTDREGDGDDGEHGRRGGGPLRPVPLAELGDITAAARKAQAEHYRNIAAMSRDDKIACGAYVYFSFLRPFAEVAGVAEEIDWTVPRDVTGPAYQLFSIIEGANTAIEEDPATFYPPLPLPEEA